MHVMATSHTIELRLSYIQPALRCLRVPGVPTASKFGASTELKRPIEWPCGCLSNSAPGPSSLNYSSVPGLDGANAEDPGLIRRIQARLLWRVDEISRGCAAAT